MHPTITRKLERCFKLFSALTYHIRWKIRFLAKRNEIVQISFELQEVVSLLTAQPRKQ